MTLKAVQLAQLLSEAQNAYEQAVKKERETFLAALDAASDLRDRATNPDERERHRRVVLGMIREFWRTPEAFRPSVTDMTKAARLHRQRVYQIRNAMNAAPRDNNETIL